MDLIGAMLQVFFEAVWEDPDPIKGILKGLFGALVLLGGVAGFLFVIAAASAAGS